MHHRIREFSHSGRAEQQRDRGTMVNTDPRVPVVADRSVAAIKQQLVEEFNLHTIVRLQQGVFAPYTDIPANLLFFERNGKTQDIWYYELPAPEGRKKYSKTAPMQFEEFAECLAWWNDRKEGPQAWKASAAEIAQRGYNLDLKNPNAKQALEHVEPAQLVARMRAHEGEVMRLLDEIEKLVGEVAA